MDQHIGPQGPQKRGIPTWAWLVIVPCGCLALLVPVAAILAAILFPVFAQARESARSTACLSNVKQQGLAVLMYQQDYDNRYPPSSTWMDLTAPYRKNEAALHCPSVPNSSPTTYGYAYNSKLSRVASDKIVRQEKTALNYDSSNLSRNAADPVTSLPSPPRHARSVNIMGFADGHARGVSAAPAP
jgi:hypothetical protein